jgi:hypothetical protein
MQEDFMSNLSRISQLTGKTLVTPSFMGKANAVVQQASQIPYTQKLMLKCTVLISCWVRSPTSCSCHTHDSSCLLASDVLLVNQTANTLQNLCLDFATLGDLKIVERPSVYTIAPHGYQSIKATIKVSSTETGVIFGSILWEGPNMSEACVILNDIHIDIMDYIKPAYCNEAQVRGRTLEICSTLIQYFITVQKYVDRVRVGEQG